MRNRIVPSASTVGIVCALVLIVVAVIIPLKVTIPPKIEMAPIVTENPRFDIKAVQTFSDSNSSSSSLKTVYVMVDKKTGLEYIGISGLGVTQLKQVGKMIAEEE